MENVAAVQFVELLNLHGISILQALNWNYAYLKAKTDCVDMVLCYYDYIKNILLEEIFDDGTAFSFECTKY